MQPQPNAKLKATFGKPLFKFLFGLILLENIENLYSLLKHPAAYNLVVFILLLLLRIVMIGFAIVIITGKNDKW